MTLALMFAKILTKIESTQFSLEQVKVTYLLTRLIMSRSQSNNLQNWQPFNNKYTPVHVSSQEDIFLDSKQITQTRLFRMKTLLSSNLGNNNLLFCNKRLLILGQQ